MRQVRRQDSSVTRGQLDWTPIDDGSNWSLQNMDGLCLPPVHVRRRSMARRRSNLEHAKGAAGLGARYQDSGACAKEVDGRGVMRMDELWHHLFAPRRSWR